MFGKTLSSFGAKPDAKHLFLVVIAAGSAMLHHGAGGFTLDDVGKTAAVAGGNGPDHLLLSPIAKYISPTQVELADAAAANAVPVLHQSATIGTDCGPALQRALDAITQKTSNEILIDGDYAQFTGTYRDFADRGEGFNPGGVQLRGYGNSYILRTACPRDVTAIGIANGTITVRGLNMTGTMGATTDAKYVIRVEAGHMRMINTAAFALMSNTGACFSGYDANLTIRDSYFGGCSGQQYLHTSVFDFSLCKGCDVRDSAVIDYGTLDGMVLSKTAIGSPRTWIQIRSMSKTPGIRTSNQGVLSFKNLRMDEGSYHQIRIGGEGTIDRAVFEDIEINAWGGSPGCIVVVNTRHVEIRRCSMGLQDGPVLSAIGLYGCTFALVDGIQVGRESSVTRLNAEGCDTVVVTNSPGFTDYNIKDVRDFSIDRKPGVLQPLSGFKYPPVAWTMAIDETAKQLCVRTAAGGWLRMQMVA